MTLLQLTKKTLAEATEETHEIYKIESSEFQLIDKKTYQEFPQGEREDSDNHLNLKCLGQPNEIIGLAHYKYLESQKTAFRVELIHQDGISKSETFFLTTRLSDV